MNKPTLSHTTGWITLAALLIFSPQLAGCDTSAPSEKECSPRVLASPHAVSTKTIDEQKPAPKKKSLSDVREVASTQKDEAAAPPQESPHAALGEPLVKRLVIATDVKNREPIKRIKNDSKEPVVAFLELSNNGEHAADVLVTFEHESGKKVGFIQLSVPAESPRYRTWGRTRNISQSGEWTAIVSTESGEELARTTFTVAS